MRAPSRMVRIRAYPVSGREDARVSCPFDARVMKPSFSTVAVSASIFTIKPLAPVAWSSTWLTVFHLDGQSTYCTNIEQVYHRSHSVQRGAGDATQHRATAT